MHSLQVYTLMKLDSYSRFLKSPLYRQCMLSEMEGKPLPLDADSDLNDSESRNSSRSLDSDTLQRQVGRMTSLEFDVLAVCGQECVLTFLCLFRRRSLKDREKDCLILKVSRRCMLSLLRFVAFLNILECAFQVLF